MKRRPSSLGSAITSKSFSQHRGTSSIPQQPPRRSQHLLFKKWVRLTLSNYDTTIRSNRNNGLPEVCRLIPSSSSPFSVVRAREGNIIMLTPDRGSDAPIDTCPLVPHPEQKM
jgi:hypothetical protein